MVLKIKLEKFHKAIVFQILEQSEKVSQVLEECDFTESDYTFSINSLEVPKLENGEIYLRHLACDKEEGLNVSAIYFGDNQERDEEYEKILKAVSKFSKWISSYKIKEIDYNLESILEF